MSQVRKCGCPVLEPCGLSSFLSLYSPSGSQKWVPALCSIVLAPGSVGMECQDLSRRLAALWQVP